MNTIQPQPNEMNIASWPPEEGNAILNEMKMEYQVLEAQACLAIKEADLDIRNRLSAEIRGKLSLLAKRTADFRPGQPEMFFSAYDLAAVFGLKIETILESWDN
jgi:hypothetical protein